MHATFIENSNTELISNEMKLEPIGREVTQIKLDPALAKKKAKNKYKISKEKMKKLDNLS